MFSVSLLLLIYPILWYDVDLDRVVKITGVVLASLTFVLVATFLTAPVSPFSAQLLDLFMRYSLGSAGNRDFLGSPVLMVRLGSSHFLLLPFALLLADLRDRFRVWTVLALLLVFAAILASTSRGVFLLSVAAAVLILGERMSNIKRAAWGLVVAPLVLAAGAVLAMRTTVFSTAEEGNSIKLGHAASFLDNLSLPHVLFGEGLAAFYYSVGLGRQVPQTEITLFDMLRYFGFVLTPIMFAALFFPALRLHHYIGDRRRVMAVALFVLYVALSLTNPVLFNSMGLSVVVWYWWRVLRPDDATPAVTQA